LGTLFEHTDRSDWHLKYGHPTSVDLLVGGDACNYQVERLTLHRPEDRIEDVAMVFTLAVDRDLSDIPRKSFQSGNDRRVSAWMRHEIDDVADRNWQMEVERGHLFGMTTASGKLGWDE